MRILFQNPLVMHVYCMTWLPRTARCPLGSGQSISVERPHRFLLLHYYWRAINGPKTVTRGEPKFEMYLFHHFRAFQASGSRFTCH